MGREVPDGWPQSRWLNPPESADVVTAAEVVTSAAEVVTSAAEVVTSAAEVVTAAAEVAGGELIVTARARSDFWRTTSYGFVHDDGHALLTDFPAGTAVEVTFLADLTEQFDQAGLMVRADERNWIKAGVEFSDGLPQLGAVVTREVSDWSCAPVPEWAGREVTIRASRARDAVTIRARCEQGAWLMIRLAPLDPEAVVSAGPVICAPTRAGLRVRFTRFVIGPADEALHG
jgi:regulation of enolase protein 1 (concanavalin A-like superfamily)